MAEPSVPPPPAPAGPPKPAEPPAWKPGPHALFIKWLYVNGRLNEGLPRDGR